MTVYMPDENLYQLFYLRIKQNITSAVVSYISQIEMNDTFYIHSNDYREASRKIREKRK